MTKEEAREILLLYRPAYRDPDDEGIEEALKIVAHDPELAAWFHQHCLLQEAVHRGLRQIQPPEALKEQILSERKAHSALGTRRALTAICALLVIVAASWMIVRQYLPSGTDRQTENLDNETFASFQNKMAADVQRLYPKMDLETNNLPLIRSYLAGHRGHDGIIIPEALANTATTGCAILAWHGKPVSMICFNSGTKPAAGKISPDLFLFVIDRAQVEAPPQNSIPKVKKVRGLATASWSAGDKVYLLGGVDDEAVVKKYL